MPSLSQARKLLAYALERPLDDSADKVAALSRAIHQAEAQGKNSGPQPEEDLVRAYKAVTDLTARQFGVTGKTLVDSESAKAETAYLGYVMAALFLLSIPVEFFSSLSVAKSMFPSFSTEYASAVDEFSSFIWGALGALVFLSKRITDDISASRYDSARNRGVAARVLLGAVLGATVAQFFNPESSAAGRVDLTDNAIAFLAGLGVKAVYGMLENAINGLARRLGVEGGVDADARKTRPSAPAD
jgi:hypothetical protein